MKASLFQAIGNFALSAKRRNEAEYADFLNFYRELVEALPSEATALFGNLPIGVTLRSGKSENYGLELTVTDYLWWKSGIEKDGIRFANGIEAVKRSMLNRFAKQAEVHRLTPDERKTLLAMIEPVS